jgi:hypothetical protein
VSEQPRLDVLRPQRLAEQGVLLQIDLANCQIIGRLPVAVQALEAVWIEVSHTAYSLVGAYSKRNWA